MYIFCNLAYGDYNKVTKDDAKLIIKKYRMKKKGVTWISTINNNYMLWNEKDTGK